MHQIHRLDFVWCDMNKRQSCYKWPSLAVFEFAGVKVEVSLGALRSVKHDTLSKNIQKWFEIFFWTGTCDSTYFLYTQVYIHKYIYIYVRIHYGQVFFFRLSLGWTRTAGRKSLSFHWQITRMVAMLVHWRMPHLKSTCLPKKGPFQRGKSSSNHYFWGAAVLIFLGVRFLLAIFCSSLDGHGPPALDMWHDIETTTTTNPPRRFPELWEVF